MNFGRLAACLLISLVDFPLDRKIRTQARVHRAWPCGLQRHAHVCARCLVWVFLIVADSFFQTCVCACNQTESHCLTCTCMGRARTPIFSGSTCRSNKAAKNNLYTRENSSRRPACLHAVTHVLMQYSVHVRVQEVLPPKTCHSSLNTHMVVCSQDR